MRARAEGDVRVTRARAHMCLSATDGRKRILLSIKPDLSLPCPPMSTSSASVFGRGA